MDLEEEMFCLKLLWELAAEGDEEAFAYPGAGVTVVHSRLPEVIPLWFRGRN